MFAIIPCPRCKSLSGMNLKHECVNCGLYREPPPNWEERAKKAEAAVDDVRLQLESKSNALIICVGQRDAARADLKALATIVDDTLREVMKESYGDPYENVADKIRRLAPRAELEACRSKKADEATVHSRTCVKLHAAQNELARANGEAAALRSALERAGEFIATQCLSVETATAFATDSSKFDFIRTALASEAGMKVLIVIEAATRLDADNDSHDCQPEQPCARCALHDTLAALNAGRVPR